MSKGEEKVTDNYDKQVLMAREIFLKYDWRAMAAKFQLKIDQEYVYLPCMDQMYRISGKTGSIGKKKECWENAGMVFPENETALGSAEAQGEYEECLDYNVVMTLYDVLCYSKEKPELANDWCPLNNLQVTMSSPDADTFTQKYAGHFSGKTVRLQEACRRIGGRKPQISAGADVCWEFDLFPFFPVQLRFWEKDEEFPPQIRLLWDKNSLKFMHFETLYYVMHLLLEHLRKNIVF